MDRKTAILMVLALIVLAVCAFVVLTVLGVFTFWQLGVFSAAPEHNRAIGFSQIKPLDASIQYKSDGGLFFAVTNAAGREIQDIEFSFSGDCEGETYIISELMAGETSTVSVDCASKDAGSSFSTDVTIEYSVTVAGREIPHTSSGMITGTVE
jgi:hypothetical protein